MNPAVSALRRSAQRLALLLGRLRGPNVMVDFEAQILVKRLALLIGPDKVRGWVDQVVDEQLSQLSVGK